MAHSDREQVLPRFSAFYLGAFFMLLLATLPLWAGRHDFPQVPLSGALVAAPRWLDLAILIAFPLVGILAVVRGPGRAVWLILTALVAASVALDQHRFQVWAYHCCIGGLISAFSSPGKVLPRLRCLTISIYFWSALSKLDVGFVSGPGQLLWGGLLTALHVDVAALPARLNQLAPWIMPAGEMAAAFALAFPRTRRIGLWMSIAMHVLLYLAVGPFGLRHELGVQLWNILFIVQNVFLFRGRPGTSVTPVAANQKPEKPAAGSTADRAIRVLLTAVLVMPALQPWGYSDVWPSWAVYSTRGGWTTIFVHHDDVERLECVPRKFIGEPPPLSDWHPIDVDVWSLAALRAPVYPQGRFRLGVATALGENVRIQVERRTPPDRRTGATTIETFELTGGALPAEVEQQFWINTRPRPLVRSRD